MNYYDVLGISPTASQETINTAHKALAKRYHPDVNFCDDAHEKMAMLNKANEVLSDTSKREKYDEELRNNQHLRHGRVISASHSVRVKQPRGVDYTEERAGKAEMLRRKAEARLKAEDAAQKRRMEQIQRREEEKAKKSKQARVERDKQYVTDVLTAIALKYHAKRNKKTEAEAEQYHATKVLLSLVKKDSRFLRRMAEETERKQRVDEILSLVKEYNEKKEWV